MIKNLKRFLIRINYIFLWACLASFSIHAKNSNHLFFENLSNPYQNTDIYALQVLQDNTGFIWAATQSGLFRYDGYNYKIFKHDPRNKDSLSDNYVEKIYVDKNNNLWVGTRYGLNKFEPNTGRFISYFNNPNNHNSLIFDHVLSITEDHRGNLWIGTARGLSIYNPTSDTFDNKHIVVSERNVADNMILSLFTDSKENVWIGTANGLNKYNPRSNKVDYFSHSKNDVRSISNNRVASITEGRDGIMWFGTRGGGLNSFNPITKEFVRYEHEINDIESLSSNEVFSVIEDSKGAIWIGTYGGGLNRMNEDGTFQRYVHEISDELSGVPSNDIVSLVEDKDGIIWLATFGNGLRKFNPYFDQFGKKVSQYNNDMSLTPGDVLSVFQDSGGIAWIGTTEGLTRFDPSSNSYTRIIHNPQNVNSLSDNEVTAIFESSNGDLWIGTYSNGLNRLLAKDKHALDFRFIHYKSKIEDRRTLSAESINSITEDSDGKIWIGTGDGLNRLDVNSGVIERFTRSENKNLDLNENTINVIVSSINEDVLVGTAGGGLNVYHKRSNRFTNYTHNPDNQNSISSNFVSSIVQDKSGIVWLATEDGLNKFNPQTGKFFSDWDDSLLRESIHSVMLDNEGALWLGNEDGIFTFRPETNEKVIKVVRKKYCSVNEGAYFQANDGTMYFGGGNGYCAFRASDIKQADPETRLVFTDFKLFNKSVPISSPQRFTPLERNIDQQTVIKLSHQDYVFSVEFSALNFDAPELTSYKYLLEGFHEDWIEVDATDRRATFSNLSAGEYKLRVSARVNGSDWGEKERQLLIEVSPAPWATWWAYTLYIAVIFTLLVSFLRYKRKADRSELVQELLQQKNDILANISHEFKTPLTLIQGPVQQILQQKLESNNRKQLETVQRNAARLNKMVGQILELAKLEFKKVKTDQVTALDILLKQVLFSMDSLFSVRNIKVNSHIESDLFAYIDSESAEKIVVNLISNAVKYGGSDSTVEISLVKQADYCSFSISDQGIGIAKEDIPRVLQRFVRLDTAVSGTGIGLALVNEIVEQAKGRLEINSEIGKGTNITVRLPLTNSNYTDIKSSVLAQDYVEQEIIVLNDAECTTQHNNGEAIDKEQQLPVVLIVEDNADMRDYIGSCLSSSFTCMYADDGVAGLRKAFNIIPDIVITDLMMPKKSGYELAQALRQDEKTAHIPIIMLTAKGSEEHRLKAWKSDIDAYLSKPFNPDELHIRAINVLNLRKIISRRLGLLIHGEETELNTIPSNQFALSDTDKQFLQKLDSFVADNFMEPDINVVKVSSALAMSERQLQRKIKAVLDLSLRDYIRNYRLEEAKRQLKAGKLAKNVALDVGFSTQNYFSQCFKAQYGITPSEYQKKL